MKELDLHGMLHHEVEDAVTNFVFLNNKNLPVRIITGNSNRMKNIVLPLLERHKYDYEVPSYNNGEVIVRFDKEYKL